VAGRSLGATQHDPSGERTFVQEADARKEIVKVNLAAANPNLSPAARFGNLGFVAGQTGRHPPGCDEKKRLPASEHSNRLNKSPCF